LTKNYVLLGAGFVAPRHYRAIKETGGNLLAILDPYDSVGIIDSYFKDCKYFREYERFDRFCLGQDIDYAVICSPNYLHDSHCLWALRSGFSAICEKPLVLNPRNLDQLLLAEDEYGGRIWNILQLRLSPILQQMKPYITQCNQVRVVYYTPRGDWYDYSWKNDVQKSGSTIFNIGIHLIDLLLYLFGTGWSISTWKNRKRSCMGHLEIRDTKVLIELSIEKDKTPTRTFIINGHDFDLSENFGDLHTLSYQKILAGEGFGIHDVFPAIDLCSHLRDH
jgi:UDP-N-acetyl-2-amino-2-deoxyglucuronate dehydrogenase